jgi:transglutaminase superfamily protein
VITRFLFWKALVGLFAYDVLRLDRNFARMHGLVRQWKVMSSPASADLVRMACEAVNHAGVWYPKRVLCIQRSAVTTCLLRSYGVPAEMVIGVRGVPFKAHAWVEVDRQAINERKDVQKAYGIWERC